MKNLSQNGWSQESKDSWLAKLQSTYKEKLKNTKFEELGHAKKRQRVFEEQNFCCNKCGLSEWLNQPISLEMEHIDGNKKNNDRTNLEGLCPNCHAQTLTYKIGNNKQPGKTIYSEASIITALQNNTSAYAAMKELGMNPHGGNYIRLRNIVKKTGLQLSYFF